MDLATLVITASAAFVLWSYWIDDSRPPRLTASGAVWDVGAGATFLFFAVVSASPVRGLACAVLGALRLWNLTLRIAGTGSRGPADGRKDALENH